MIAVELGGVHMMGCAYLYIFECSATHSLYAVLLACSFTTCRDYVLYVLLAHIITHTEHQSYYVTLLLLIVVQEVFVFCFGCYGRAQHVYWVVHQTIVRAFNRYLFLMKYIFHVSSNMNKL